MNTRAEIALESLIVRYHELLGRCDTYEETGRWDTESLGYLSAYLESDLMAVMLQVMSSDGVFEHAETEVINRMFDQEYTTQDLREIYRTLGPVIDDYCDGEAQDALSVLRSCDVSLCDEYRNLIIDACSVISAADGIAEGLELDVIRKLQDTLNAY